MTSACYNSLQLTKFTPEEDHSLVSGFPMDKTMNSYRFVPFGKVFPMTPSQNEAMKIMF